MKDLEVRLQSLRAEHGSARDREEQRQRENAELNSRLAEADKVIHLLYAHPVLFIRDILKSRT